MLSFNPVRSNYKPYLKRRHHYPEVRATINLLRAVREIEKSTKRLELAVPYLLEDIKIASSRNLTITRFETSFIKFYTESESFPVPLVI